MIKDDKESHLKLLAFGGVIALSLGFGYSLGLNHILDSPSNQIKLGPVDAESIVLLRQAGQRARRRGTLRRRNGLSKRAAIAPSDCWLGRATGRTADRRFMLGPSD